MNQEMKLINDSWRSWQKGSTFRGRRRAKAKSSIPHAPAVSVPAHGSAPVKVLFAFALYRSLDDKDGDSQSLSSPTPAEKLIETCKPCI
ncbi:uncharacterized protein [Physcomitrium patens]